MSALLACREGSLKKKVLCQNGKKLERKNILLIIIGKFFKEFFLFLKFGDLFRK